MALDLDIPIKQLDKNQARFYLAVSAVTRLESSLDGEDWTRTDLFAPSKDEENESPALRKQGSSKDWQRQFLIRLTDYGFLEDEMRSGQHFYTVKDRAALKSILADVRDGDGVSIKRVLWPHLYEELDEEGESELEEDEPSEDEPSEEGASELDVVREVASQLKTLAGHLGTIVQNFESYEKRMSAVEKYVGDIGVQVEQSLQRIEQTFDTVTSEERSRLIQLTTLTIESVARKKSLLNQLDSSLQKDEKTLVGLDELLEKLKENVNGE